MRTRRFKSLLWSAGMLLLITCPVLAEEAVKEYHAEFDADRNTMLVLQNKYGSIDVLNREDAKVSIDVLVTVKTGNQERAERMLDQITVTITESGSTIKAVTEIDDRISRGNWADNQEFDIAYTVHAPKYISLDLYQKYGDAFVDEIDGHARLELNYGKLTVNKLGRGNEKPLNTVSLGYANGSSISECQWLKASIKYSSLDIDKVRAFVGYTSYMKLRIGEASSVVIEGKYDGYTIGRASNLVINTGYSNVRVDELSTKLEAEAKYSDFRVEEMPAGFESIHVNSKYGSIRIGVSPEASYLIDGHAAYCKISYHDEPARVDRIQEGTSMSVSGRIGPDENPTATVKVHSRYGNVRLDY